MRQKLLHGLIVVVLLLSLVWVIRCCVAHQVPAIQAGLTERAQAALSEQSLDWAKVQFSGRDARLYGSAPDVGSRDLAADTLSQLRGVRVVQSDVQLIESVPLRGAASSVKVRPAVSGPAPAVTAAAPPSYSVQFNTRLSPATLTGVVPDAATASTLVDAARAQYGDSGGVRSELRVQSGGPRPAWLPAAVGAIAASSALDQAVVSAGSNGVELAGVAPDAATRDQVARIVGASQARHGDKVTMSMRVRLAPPAAAAPGPALGQQPARAPVPAKFKPCQDAFDRLLAADKIQFKTDSANISPASDALLAELVKVTRQCPDATVQVSGHSDSRGDQSYNLDLSERRAEAVVIYLVDQGVHPDRVTAIGHGERFPIATNGTRQGRARNRRIEFNIIP